jgi:hypothetical protein
MIPIPNVVAGVLIGYTSPGWTELLVAAAAWPIAYCAYVSLADRERAMAAVAHILSRAHRRLPGSPMLTFYVIELVTSFATAVGVGVVVFILKRAFS